MCGFVGSASPLTKVRREIISTMSSKIHFRGPDDYGEWVNSTELVAFGFKRLAIIDLSATGHQPMHSRSARYSIVYNGEIYNAASLSIELRGLGHAFIGHSDTEVILAAFEQWGIEKALKRFTGMFAIACWDQVRNSLTLVRDRFGEKPLYYGWCDGGLRFGSNLDAIISEIKPQLSSLAVDRYFRFGYVPGPLTIYKGFFKLPPGRLLELELGACGECPKQFDPISTPKSYWSVGSLMPSSSKVECYSDHEVCELFSNRFVDVVRQQMTSDVPLGAFLSGGIDSSTIVAIMRRISSSPIQSFTIGFSDHRYNEAPFARAIAEHLGTSHTEVIVDTTELLEIIPKLAAIFDEPFADSSQIPTLLVAQLARRKVTVSLSGDGGDELFGGYSRYRATVKLAALMRILPLRIRNLLIKFVSITPDIFIDNLFGLVLRNLSPEIKRLSPSVAARRASQFLTSTSFAELYSRMVSIDGASIFRHDFSNGFDTACWWRENSSSSLNDLRSMMMVDANSYLPDDILVKLDRTTMSVSLEGRMPLLDHGVWELLWKLPEKQADRLLKNKLLLRTILNRDVPPSLTDRPKMGFGVPIAEWIGGPLRDWAEALLSTSVLDRTEFLDSFKVRSLWEQFLKGSNKNTQQLWTLLMYLSWSSKRS